MNIKVAAQTDFLEIKNLYYSLIDSVNGRTDSVKWEKGVYPSDEFLLSSISKGELFIATEDNKLIGSLVINNICSDAYTDANWQCKCKDDEFLILHALCISPNYHKKGYGKSFLLYISDYAKKNNKKAIRLDILEGNTAAHNLYLSSGFKFIEKKKLYYPDTGLANFLLFELVL